MEKLDVNVYFEFVQNDIHFPLVFYFDNFIMPFVLFILIKSIQGKPYQQQILSFTKYDEYQECQIHFLGIMVATNYVRTNLAIEIMW